ncbi:hypothetical protein ACFW5X_11820 [Streptomyces albogriseolus]|uniref:hypothetical protein n=1 Tax=Streptomyces TaxID=1883 RepID=UPI002A74A254|nr:hypothetical protein [Streptomyces sp. CL7]WPP32099.1 hypothetical protein SJH97_23470 [Streptomyces sp. CL7]
MTRRSFSISQVSETAGEGVLDVPSLSVLRYKDPETLLSDFESLWGVRASAVALPVLEPDGLLFEVKGLRGIPSSNYTAPSARLKNFADVVKVFLAAGLDIILTLYPGHGFIPGDGIHTRDIAGGSANRVCIANPRTSQIFGAILGTGIDIASEVAAATKGGGKIRGVALDVTELWGISGQLGRVEKTCFCTACVRHFDKNAPDLLKHYRTFPNPWSLLLRSASSTGMTHVSDVSVSMSAEEIVGLARQRKFDEQFPDLDYADLLRMAELLLRYMRVRHSLTVSAIGSLFDYACEGLEEQLTRVVMLEGELYGWTSGLWLEELDTSFAEGEETGYDELWLDSGTPYVPQHVPYRSYMWSRSRYYISQFFQLSGALCDPRSRIHTGLRHKTVEECRQMIVERWQMVHGSALNAQAALLTLPTPPDAASDARLGFVGVGLQQEYGKWFSDQLTIPPTSSERRGVLLGPGGGAPAGLDLASLLEQFHMRGEDE